MTTKKALQILHKQRNKIDDPRHPNDETWIYQTAEYIRRFFGDDSTHFSFINKFTFAITYTNRDDPEDVSRWITERPLTAKKFLDTCIETLEDVGLIKQPKVNFLNRLSDNALWTIIAISVPAICSLGFIIGQYFSDVKNIELRQELAKTKDSLSKNNLYYLEKKPTKIIQTNPSKLK